MKSKIISAAAALAVTATGGAIALNHGDDHKNPKTTSVAKTVNTNANTKTIDKDNAVSRDMQRKALPVKSSASAKPTIAQHTIKLSYKGQKPITLKVNDNTHISAFLKNNHKDIVKNDVVSPNANTKITKDTNITVNNIVSSVTNKNEAISKPATITVKDNNIQKGYRQTVTGHSGEKTVTYKTTITNGKNKKIEKTNEKIVKNAIADTIVVGTKTVVNTTKPTPAVTHKTTQTTTQNIVKTAPTATSTKQSAAKTTPKTYAATTTKKSNTYASAAQTTTNTAKATNSNTTPTNTSNAAMWDKIAACESSGNWQIDSGNNYFGGLQFDHATWISNGGGKYGYNANLATKAQQIDIANKLYAARGLQPWQCGWAAYK